jgi:hypothetical protein
MGEITQQILELLESGANIEEYRSAEVIAKSKGFDRVFGKHQSGNDPGKDAVNPDTSTQDRPPSTVKPK